jgi:hypothetical protein
MKRSFVVEVPSETNVLDRAGRRVLGVVLDADGMQHIVVWRVVARSQARR